MGAPPFCLFSVPRGHTKHACGTASAPVWDDRSPALVPLALAGRPKRLPACAPAGVFHIARHGWARQRATLAHSRRSHGSALRPCRAWRHLLPTPPCGAGLPPSRRRRVHGYQWVPLCRTTARDPHAASLPRRRQPLRRRPPHSFHPFRAVWDSTRRRVSSGPIPSPASTAHARSCSPQRRRPPCLCLTSPTWRPTRRGQSLPSALLPTCYAGTRPPA